MDSNRPSKRACAGLTSPSLSPSSFSPPPLLLPLANPVELIPAAKIGDEATVASCLRHPHLADPNIADVDGVTALIHASHLGHDSVMEVLLADERVDPNIITSAGNTALIFAADQPHLSAVKLLLADRRVDPNMANMEAGTALIVAADQGHDEVVTALLDHRRVAE